MGINRPGCGDTFAPTRKGDTAAGPTKGLAYLGFALLIAISAALPAEAAGERKGDVSCADFPSQAAAQSYFETQPPGDPAGLDPDGDGVACEENPCPCSPGAGGGDEPPPPDPANTRLPKLDRATARALVRKALKREFDFYGESKGRDNDCRKRVSRIRFRCRASFAGGDLRFHGPVTVRYVHKNGDQLGYRYAIRLEKFDSYCFEQPGGTRSACTETIKRTGEDHL